MTLVNGVKVFLGNSLHEKIRALFGLTYEYICTDYMYVDNILLQHVAPNQRDEIAI